MRAALLLILIAAPVQAETVRVWRVDKPILEILSVDRDEGVAALLTVKADALEQQLKENQIKLPRMPNVVIRLKGIPFARYDADGRESYYRIQFNPAKPISLTAKGVPARIDFVKVLEVWGFHDHTIFRSVIDIDVVSQLSRPIINCVINSLVLPRLLPQAERTVLWAEKRAIECLAGK